MFFYSQCSSLAYRTQDLLASTLAYPFNVAGRSSWQLASVCLQPPAWPKQRRTVYSVVIINILAWRK